MKYEVTALVKHDGRPAGSVALAPGKAASSYEGTLEVTAPGTWEVTVYAFDPANGNAGVDVVSFTAR
jgi:hypothetical protein